MHGAKINYIVKKGLKNKKQGSDYYKCQGNEYIYGGGKR